MRVIELSEETLAFDSIRRVAPGGSYLTDDLTLRYLRRETFEQEVGDRRTRAQWLEAGAPEVLETARSQAREMLRNAPRPDLPDEVEKNIRGRFDIRL